MLYTFNFKTILSYLFYLLIGLFIFSKEFIVINEEFLIILSFLAVFFGLQYSLSDILKNELNDRNIQIKKQFINLYNIKANFQTVLISILEKKLLLLNSLKNYSTIVKNLVKVIVLNRNLITKETLNVYVEQILSIYIIKYNFELKKVYLDILTSINSKINLNKHKKKLKK